MAVYRQIYTTFWQDDFILSIPYTDRYFYIYLMTNSKTTICGIYELPRAVAVMETGLTLAKVEELLIKFEKQYHRVVCSKKTNEIVITNWLKYNNNSSPKVQTAIKAAFALVKDKALINFAFGYGIDMVSNKNDTVSENGDTISASDDTVNDNDNAIVTDIVPVIEEEKDNTKEQCKTIIERWNEVESVAHIDCIEHKRLEMTRTRLKEKGFDKFIQMIENVKLSPFLLGKKKDKDGKAFKATFDWCICPNNFQKVLDGNYIAEDPKESFDDEINRRARAALKVLGRE